MTLFVEFHGWRGFSRAGGELLYFLVLAFVTIGFCPYQITQKIDELTRKLKELVDK